MICKNCTFRGRCALQAKLAATGATSCHLHLDQRQALIKEGSQVEPASYSIKTGGRVIRIHLPPAANG